MFSVLFHPWYDLVLHTDVWIWQGAQICPQFNKQVVGLGHSSFLREKSTKLEATFLSHLPSTIISFYGSKGIDPGLVTCCYIQRLDACSPAAILIDNIDTYKN